MLRRSGLALALAFAISTPLQAQSLGVDFTTPTVFGNSVWTLGYNFTALANTSVVGLGVFDGGLDGLNGNVDVGLWTDGGTLLASTSIAQGSGAMLMSFFRTVSISPVALSAGSSYVVGAWSPNDVYASTRFASGGFFTDSRIQYNNDQWLSGSFGFGTDSNAADQNSQGWFGGNVVLESVSVPEPGSLALIAAGLLGLVGIRRREVALDPEA